MSFLGLFEGYGIELEYAIVDRNSFKVQPISDEVMKSFAGKIVSDLEDGDITWSNELVLHVLELKTSGPAATLEGLENSFGRSIKKLSLALRERGCRLMPTAMHPLMNPDEEMKLWPHDNNEIYDLYNKIFDCRGHGWSNLTSMHINYPFRTDEEFERLHTAIRFILPLLPALAASSPIFEGKSNVYLDNRLLFYQKNQKRIPSITGQVIPELVGSMADYHSSILSRLYEDIAPHDPQELMREDWLNSRGAIARFERQSIEIRVLDLQEAPFIDIAIADFVTSTLKCLVDGDLVPRAEQRRSSTEELKAIFNSTVHHAELAVIEDAKYLAAWSSNPALTAGQIWRKIFSSNSVQSKMTSAHRATIDQLLRRGSLATRISQSLGLSEGNSPSASEILGVYSQLCDCLDENRMYEVGKM